MVEIRTEHPNPQGQPARLTQTSLQALDAQHQQQEEEEQEAEGWEEVPDHNEAPPSLPSTTVTRVGRRSITARSKYPISVKGNLRARRSARTGKPSTNRSDVVSVTFTESPDLHVKQEQEDGSVPVGNGRGRGRAEEMRLRRDARHFGWNAVAYGKDVTALALSLLKKPLGVLLFLFLFSILLVKIWGTMHVALRPVCQLPFISKMEICVYVNHYNNAGGQVGRDGKPKSQPHWADFPTLTDVQTKSMGKLLEESAESTGLSLEIKKAEVATADLITIVEHSGLQSKVTLARLLKDFVNEARVTGAGLQKFNAKVGGAIDQILVINDHALRTIEATQATLPKAGSLASYMPWAPDPAEVDVIVTRTFADAMNIVSGELTRLILEAQLSLQNLNSLDESLNALNTLIVTEGVIQNTKREEILADIWTFFGGNRKELREVGDHTILLREITGYKKQATAHVQGALHTLGEMSQAIEELRARVAAPRLLANLKSSEGFQSDVGDIPVHLHIKSIQMGLERLKEGKDRAKMLQQAVIQKVLDRNLGNESRKD